MAAASTFAAVTAAALVLAGGSGAQGEVTVAPGFDLFETDPEQTVFRFRGQNQIPPNFFGQGSQPFQGDVQFGGVPLGRFMNRDVGSADTVVEREQLATVPPGGQSEPVPIELVQLALVSVAPIEVRVGDSTQLWDVRADVSPTRPSTGQMVIRTGTGGGAFDSQLRVYPRFTFTRLSDGETRQLDVGALPDGQRPDDPLQATNTPWRTGCVPPALDTKLSPRFCPGQGPRGRIVVTLEQSPQATHAVRPVQPRLEHFACYTASKTKNPKSIEVKLADQFGSRSAKVARERGLLCNPARKNKELAVRNKRDHFRCYKVDRASIDRQVRLRNQFDLFAAVVAAPRELCVPSVKQVVPKSGKLPKPPAQRFLADHFQCYEIKAEGTFTTRTVTLRDQFGTRKVKVRTPSRLCAPVDKNGEGIKHPVQHLVCYPARPGKAVAKNVRTVNQFGSERFRVAGFAQLCLPSIKVPQR